MRGKGALFEQWCQTNKAESEQMGELVELKNLFPEEIVLNLKEHITKQNIGSMQLAGGK